MRPLLFGALVGFALVVLGVPLTVPVRAVLPLLAEPTVLAFAAGLIARPHLTRRWPT